MTSHHHEKNGTLLTPQRDASISSASDEAEVPVSRKETGIGPGVDPTPAADKELQTATLKFDFTSRLDEINKRIDGA